MASQFSSLEARIAGCPPVRRPLDSHIWAQLRHVPLSRLAGEGASRSEAGEGSPRDAYLTVRMGLAAVGLRRPHPGPLPQAGEGNALDHAASAS
jgi:hypothetical protein